MNCFGTALLALAFVFLSVPFAVADIILNTVGTAVLEDFDDFRGAGFSSSPGSGQLDSNTYRATGLSDGDGTFGGIHETGDFARGTSSGGETTGGAYAFEIASGDFAAGIQPDGGNFAPGALTIRVMNQTGVAITAIDVSAQGLFFNDENRSSRWIFAGSLDDNFYADFFTLDSPTTADLSPVWAPTFVGGRFIFPTPLENNQRFFVRITGSDLGGTGARDEFALNNLSFTAVPEPNSMGLICLLSGMILVRRRKTRASERD